MQRNILTSITFTTMLILTGCMTTHTIDPTTGVDNTLTDKQPHHQTAKAQNTSYARGRVLAAGNPFIGALLGT